MAKVWRNPIFLLIPVSFVSNVRHTARQGECSKFLYTFSAYLCGRKKCVCYANKRTYHSPNTGLHFISSFSHLNLLFRKKQSILQQLQPLRIKFQYRWLKIVLSAQMNSFALFLWGHLPIILLMFSAKSKCTKTSKPTNWLFFEILSRAGVCLFCWACVLRTSLWIDSPKRPKRINVYLIQHCV